MEPTQTLAEVAQAVTGPDTPAAASVHSEPPRAPVWALVLAGPAVSAMLVVCVWIMAFQFWPGAMALKSEALAERIILSVASVCTALAIILGIIAFRLASGNLRSIKAQAGPGSIEIGA